jgi:hypothetical protein
MLRAEWAADGVSSVQPDSVNAGVASPLAVGDQEGLGGDVVGRAGPQAARHVPVISLKRRSKISAKAWGESRERAACGARSSSGGGFAAGGACALKPFQAVVTQGVLGLGPSGRTALTPHRPQARPAFTAGAKIPGGYGNQTGPQES